MLAPAGKTSSHDLDLPKAWFTIPLATATTAADGSFALSLDDQALSSSARSLLRCGDMLSLRVVVKSAGKTVETTPTLRASEWRDDLVFTVARRKLASSRIDGWLKAAAKANVASLSGLAAFANNPTARRGLDAIEAAEAAAWLERVFLDPTGLLGKTAPLPGFAELSQDEGLRSYQDSLRQVRERKDVAAALATLEAKVRSFDGLNQVDWPIALKNTNTIRFGDLIQEIGAKYIVPGKLGIPQFPPSPYIGYRDYLVETWQKYIALRNKNPWITGGNASPAQALEQLNNRFKQNFATTDVSRVPANKLVIAIVRNILTAAAPPADIGCGVAAADIPAQGTSRDRDYLDNLIAQSGAFAAEFSLRYRIDVERPDSAQSSPVEENIATLLGFLRDSFQSDLDPAHALPDVYQQPIVQPMMLQEAPFFLEYEEWLDATAPFYPENFLSLRRMLDSSRMRLNGSSLDSSPYKSWIQKTQAVMDEVDKAHAAFDKGEYRIAANRYRAAWEAAFGQMQDGLVTEYGYKSILAQRRRFNVSKKAELLKFELLMQMPDSDFNPDPISFADWYKDRQVMWLIMFFSYAYNIWMGDCLLALGRLPEANRHYAVLSAVAIGAAEFDSESGPFDWWNDGDPNLYNAGNLPYTFLNSEKEAGLYTDPLEPDRIYARPVYSTAPALYPFRPRGIAPLLHRLERKFIALRLGDAMLAWADLLFRSNDASSVARARELYKGVMWLHGEDPGVSPQWEPLPVIPGIFFNNRGNPSRASQTQRASLALYKIGRGLNYYGYTDAHVPTLRYRSLKDSADRFAALAKAAQQDFLNAMTGLENITVEELKISNLVTKALKQQDIASEQIKIANVGVTQAQQQIDVVQKQIDAKRKELTEKESFWNQFSDFAGGLVKTFKGLPGGAAEALGGAAASEAGLSSAGAAGFMGIGAAATVTAGFAVFGYAGYTSMSAMADTYSNLGDQIKALENVAMPAAKVAKSVKDSELKIARLNSDIVAADVQLGRNLLAYHDNKLLNGDFYVAMANVMKRAMQRYLELGAWAGWLAERALAFEQSRNINLMRLDYFPRALQGVTGADLLQLDLAELEASRIAGTKAMVPFRHTFSLLADFPLAFGQLKALGRCEFLTNEATLRIAYPGTFGHRIDTVSTVLSGAAAPKGLHGILSNPGVSIASRDETMSAAPLVAAPAALPIGELAATTRLSETVLPSDVLKPFEGSGTTSLWRLTFSEPVTAPAMNGLLDVLVTVEGRALYANSLPSSAPTAEHHSIMLSGRRIDAAGFAKFKDGGAAQIKIAFDLPALLPAASGQVRKIVNLGVLLPGLAEAAVKASMVTSTGTIAFKTKDGYALSNGEPLRLPGSAVPAAELNPLIGKTLDQKLTITFARAGNAAVDFGKLLDVMLLVEYSV